VFLEGYEKEWERVQTCMRDVLNKKRVRQAYKPVRKFLRYYF